MLLTTEVVAYVSGYSATGHERRVAVKFLIERGEEEMDRWNVDEHSGPPFPLHCWLRSRRGAFSGAGQPDQAPPGYGGAGSPMGARLGRGGGGRSVPRYCPPCERQMKGPKDAGNGPEFWCGNCGNVIGAWRAPLRPNDIPARYRRGEDDSTDDQGTKIFWCGSCYNETPQH